MQPPLNVLVPLVVGIVLGLAQAGDTAWNTAMSAIQVQCGQTGIAQDPVSFVGTKDECDDNTKVLYEPTNSAGHLDMVIDPRNSDTIEWDTARYKRYGTYWPTANVTWHIPNGFKNFWARIYYAADNDKKFEPMKYQYSKDRTTWTPVPNVQYDVNMVCVQPDCNWYKRKEELASWDDTMYYFKAIWPAPCAGEIGATYSADQRKCLSLPPSGWTGTLEEFDASPTKDLYYTPQMGEIIFDASDVTPPRPQNVKLTPGPGSVLATWDPPSNPTEPIIGYTVYYQLSSTGSATDPTYKPPYLAKYVNVGMVSGVILTNIDPTLTIIVRVASVSQRGAGPSTINVWTQANANVAALTCPVTLAPVSTIVSSVTTLSPAPIAEAKGTSAQATTTSSAASAVFSISALIVVSVMLMLS